MFDVACVDPRLSATTTASPSCDSRGSEHVSLRCVFGWDLSQYLVGIPWYSLKISFCLLAPSDLAVKCRSHFSSILFVAVCGLRLIKFVERFKTATRKNHPVSPAIYQRTIWPSDLSMLLKKIASKEHALKRTKKKNGASKNSEVSSGYVVCLHDYTTHAHLWYPHFKNLWKCFFQAIIRILVNSNAFSKCFRDFFGCFASNSGAKPYHVPEPHSAGRGKGMGGMGVPQVVSSPLKGSPPTKELGIFGDCNRLDVYR